MYTAKYSVEIDPGKSGIIEFSFDKEIDKKYLSIMCFNLEDPTSNASVEMFNIDKIYFSEDPVLYEKDAFSSTFYNYNDHPVYVVVVVWGEQKQEQKQEQNKKSRINIDLNLDGENSSANIFYEDDLFCNDFQIKKFDEDKTRDSIIEFVKEIQTAINEDSKFSSDFYIMLYKLLDKLKVQRAHNKYAKHEKKFDDLVKDLMEDAAQYEKYWK